MLQKKLNKTQRSFIIKRLFKEIVKKNVGEFSKELYMSKTDLKLLIKKGFQLVHIPPLTDGWTSSITLNKKMK